jgi:hypothetical protein
LAEQYAKRREADEQCQGIAASGGQVTLNVPARGISTVVLTLCTGR